jgi:4-hydroxybenzoate polyprenyltransferase
MIKRLWIYISEMIPVIPTILFSIMWTGGLLLIANALLTPVGSVGVTHEWVGAAITVLLWLLFLRATDEFKDFEIDSRLFKDRPLPSGRVKRSDLYFLIALLVSGMWGINLFWLSSPLAFSVLFLYGLLMFKFFFFKRAIQKSLVLALITHNPNVLIVNFFILTIAAQATQAPLFTENHWFLAVWFWIPAITWELSRKIRAPEDEDAYETYSQVFGTKLSAGVPLLFYAIHFVMLLIMFKEGWVSFYLIVGQSLLLVAAIWGSLKFILRPSSKTSWLRPYAEAYMILAYLGVAIDIICKRGIVWM